MWDIPQAASYCSKRREHISSSALFEKEISIKLDPISYFLLMYYGFFSAPAGFVKPSQSPLASDPPPEQGSRVTVIKILQEALITLLVNSASNALVTSSINFHILLPLIFNDETTRFKVIFLIPVCHSEQIYYQKWQFRAFPSSANGWNQTGQFACTFSIRV